MTVTVQVDTSKSQIYLRNLRFEALIGDTAWGKTKAQPVVISVRLQRNFDHAGQNDDVDHTLSYSVMCKQILELARVRTANNTNPCAEDSFHNAIHENAHVRWGWGSGLIEVETTLPKGILRAEGGSTLRTASEMDGKTRKLVLAEKAINCMRIPCIIGVNSYERLKKQMVELNMRYREWEGVCSQVSLADFIVETVEASEFETLEALAYRIGKAVEELPLLYLTVSIEKPNAIDAVDGSGVEVTFKNDNAMKSSANEMLLSAAKQYYDASKGFFL